MSKSVWKSPASASAAILCFAALHASAQNTRNDPATGPKFEVASVHLISPRDQTTADKGPATVNFSGARVAISGFALTNIIATAYRTETYLLTSPDWTAQTRVVIQALMPQGATKDQLPEMMKALLAERFHLVAHTVMIDEPVYALVIAKNGPKLNPPRDLDQATCAGWSDKSGFDDFQGCNKAGGQSSGTTVRTQVSIGGPNGPTRFEMSSDGDLLEVREEYLRMSMQQLARRMSVPCAGSCLNLPVVDRTGIAGQWDFSLNRTCSGSNCDTYASSLEKIGLKVEKTIAPVERLVVDQIDKAPAEN
jgi:uncharacterized protein (TIGR03435 family)